MEKYIALLRGVNVGGKNKISMPDLKCECEKHGFSNVTTYINSGNILFENENTSEEMLMSEWEAMIEIRFNLKISVMILSAKDLSIALEHAPSWWNTDTGSKHNAIFIIPPVTAEEVCRHVGEIKPEYEKVACYGQVIFWSAPIKTFSRTRWSKVAGSSVYRSMTIRNANTTIKLSQLEK